MKAIGSRMRQTVSRAQAASMLRAARRALAVCDERAGETIGWTLTALRNNYCARLIKIDYLLNAGHWDSADALIARTIMHLRDHPLLRLRLARSFFEQGRIEQAAKEIRRVLKERPEHIGALSLAARIAGAQGNQKRAAALWMQASDLRPQDDAIRAAFVQSLLDAKLIRHAAVECARLANPPALLKARVLCAQGRTLDALEHLHAAITGDAVDADVVCELIDVYERAGDVVRFRELLPRIVDAPIKAQLRAAKACLTFGEFDQAIALATRVATEPLWSDRALRVMHIAQLMRGDSGGEAARFNDDHADRSIRHHGEHRASIAKLWINAMLGRLTVRQGDSRQAGADPFASVLQPLMKQALRVIEAAADAIESLGDREAARAHRDMLTASLRSSMVQTHSRDLGPAQQIITPESSDDQVNVLRRAA